MTPGKPAFCALGGAALQLYPEGAALVASEATLIVADLHLEKASAFAAQGQMLPPYETLETLQRLDRLVRALTPKRLVMLGDSFHSPVHAIDATSPSRRLIDGLGQMVDLVWVSGNHDPHLPVAVPGIFVAEWRIGPLVLRHEPADDGRNEVVGHLHPASRLATRGGSQKKKCFVLSPRRLLMPAFGTLTGGVEVTRPDIARWFREPGCHAFLLGRGALHQIPL